MKSIAIIISSLMCLFWSAPVTPTNENHTRRYEETVNGYSQESLNKTPGPRAMHHLLYDSQQKRILLVDGYYPSIQPARSEIWVWDGIEWKRIDTSGPEPRYANAAAFDTHRKRLIINGGRVGKNELIIGDTWEWDGLRWFVVQDSSTNARDHHTIVYQEAEGKTIMYGGGIFPRKPGPWATDTWEWNGNRWSMASMKGPIGRVAPMIYDDSNKRLILFGGVGAPPGPNQQQPDYNDTWAFQQGNWRKLSDVGPRARNRHAMAWDNKRNRIILYGGSVRQEVLSDMWQWDGKEWTEIKLSGNTPGKRCLHAMGYDTARDRIVLYGGNNGTSVDGETWEWDGAGWIKKSE